GVETGADVSTDEEAKPSGLSEARDRQADDLKRISGVGQKIEGILNDLGIFHFDQIAEWTPENVAWIDDYLSFKGRIGREDWIGQAKILVAGGETKFAKRVDAGEVETSKDEG
ncbi:MAG: NADH-quinone oxidoreductase subunit E, partial [Methyloligellaceae bacterium]